ALLLAPAAGAGTPSAVEVNMRLQAVLDQAVAPDSKAGALAGVSAPRLGIEWNGASSVRGARSQPGLLPNQPFRIASITKVFVAATVFRLVEEHRLGLFDAIAPRLSAATAASLRAGGYHPERITTQQLLSHTSGLYDYAGDPAFAAAILASPHKRWTRAEEIKFAMTHGKPVGKPGERYAYSDTGYLILGEAIENITRQSLPSAVREQLDLKGLGLESTYFESLEKTPPGALPPAHQYLDATDTSGFDPSFDLYGGGGLVSTTADLDRFLRALLQGRIFKHRSTLAAALMTVDAQHDAGDHLHANLLTTWHFGKRVCWAHLGFWSSEALYCPDADIAVSFTLNQGNPSNPDALADLASALASVIESQNSSPDP
ncbi:MAG: serine hydrolase domain-containing protein, partial [Steroidobacteraceae bacterium]